MAAQIQSTPGHRSRHDGSFWGKVRTAWKVMHERRALAAMPMEQLADLGLSETDAMREAGRPLWDLPNGR